MSISLCGPLALTSTSCSDSSPLVATAYALVRVLVGSGIGGVTCLRFWPVIGQASAMIREGYERGVRQGAPRVGRLICPRMRFCLVSRTIWMPLGTWSMRLDLVREACIHAKTYG